MSFTTAKGIYKHAGIAAHLFNAWLMFIQETVGNCTEQSWGPVTVAFSRKQSCLWLAAACPHSKHI